MYNDELFIYTDSIDIAKKEEAWINYLNTYENCSEKEKLEILKEEIGLIDAIKDILNIDLDNGYVCFEDLGNGKYKLVPEYTFEDRFKLSECIYNIDGSENRFFVDKDGEFRCDNYKKGKKRNLIFRYASYNDKFYDKFDSILANAYRFDDPELNNAKESDLIYDLNTINSSTKKLGFEVVDRNYLGDITKEFMDKIRAAKFTSLYNNHSYTFDDLQNIISCLQDEGYPMEELDYFPMEDFDEICKDNRYSPSEIAQLITDSSHFDYHEDWFTDRNYLSTLTDDKYKELICENADEIINFALKQKEHGCEFYELEEDNPFNLVFSDDSEASLDKKIDKANDKVDKQEINSDKQKSIER